MNSPCASKEYRRDRIDMSDETSVHKIAGYTEAVRRLGPFFWTDFPTVKRLHVDRATSGIGEYVVRLTIESDDGSERRFLAQQFTAVRTAECPHKADDASAPANTEAANSEFVIAVRISLRAPSSSRRSHRLWAT